MELLTTIYKNSTKKEIENELDKFSHYNDWWWPTLSKEIVEILHEKGIYEWYITQ